MDFSIFSIEMITVAMLIVYLAVHLLTQLKDSNVCLMTKHNPQGDGQ